MVVDFILSHLFCAAELKQLHTNKELNHLDKTLAITTCACRFFGAAASLRLQEDGPDAGFKMQEESESEPLSSFESEPSSKIASSPCQGTVILIFVGSVVVFSF